MADADEHGEELSRPRIELRPGATLGDRYVIEKMIGRGGIGAVFLASDRNLLGRRVVIKVLLDEISQSNTGDYFRRKFRHEMQALSRINHPGVVGILDAGSTPDGGAFLVMEYVDGITLRAELDDLIRNHIEGMPFDRAAHIIRQVGQALSAAHARNVHHRDLKPENIMIETSGDGEQQVKIIDFGIASITDSQTFKTSTAIIGTIAYMAPEQFLRKPSAASDVFALGVIAYEMLTGRRPFNPPTQFQALDVLKQGLRVKPSALRPDLPPAAEEIILRALSFDERDRPPKAKDLGDDLALALTAPLKEPFPEPAEPASPPASPARSGTEPIGSPSTSPAQVEMAHVLSLEMMEFSRLKTQQQLHLVRELQRIVRDTEEFRSATQRKEVICRSAGYAMKIVFRRDPESPARCAIQIARAAREHEHIRLRMGIHSGLVAVHEDINFNIDAAGAGINTAQSIMECGDAGHILVSSSARDLLDEAGEWASSLADLGEWEIRPGERARLFNFCADGAGNPERPARVRAWESGSRDEADEKSARAGSSPHPRAPLLTQTLNVVYHRDPGGQEGLRYTPQPLGDVVPPHALVRIQSQILQSYIESVRQAADDLTWRALANQNRGGLGIEQSAGELARYVLPEKGIAGVIGQGVHPQFDTYLDIASEIPWEALEENYLVCSNGHRAISSAGSFKTCDSFCERCGERMVQAGGKLALTYHLTHLVHGSGRAGGEGRQFLFIEDPCGDICDPRRDPEGICAGHLETLHQIVERLGYTINLLRGSNATARRVLKAISDPSVVAIYYFGHGYFPREGDQGRLVLRDASLSAGEIEAAAPAARFVFLNACEGAASGRNWSLDNRPRNVANAFAQGSLGKVVISPLLPVVSKHAAEAALEFFEHATTASPLGKALKKARTMSFLRYQAGEPHLAWMAYRYLGDPNKPLPAPAEAAITVITGEPAASRVFGEDEQIDEEVFSFALDEILFRAAKRRNLQARKTISMQDLIAGLLRKGDLTRFLLRKRGRDPDRCYEKIYEVREESDLQAGESNEALQALLELSNIDFDNLGEEKLREIFSKWVVREKKEFRPEVVSALEKADRRAQRRQQGDQRISEQDLLESIIEDSAWPDLSEIGVLSPAEMRQLLDDHKLAGEVNENGEISLAALDVEARKVVETAHILSKQRGEFPIPNRLMLAALLADEKRFGSQVLRRTGCDPQKLFELMMAAAEGSPPLNFGLSEEACSRVVMPVLEFAAAWKSEGEQIQEADLFRAFCAKADPKFKQALREMQPEVDLNFILGLLDMTAGAEKVIETAHTLAQQRGVSPIPSRLMLAAFLTEPESYPARAFRDRGIPADRLRHQLIGLTGSPDPREFPLDKQTCEKVVTPTIDRAREIAAGRRVSEEILFKAFCDIAPAGLKESFREAGLDLDAFGSGVNPAHAPQPGAAREGSVVPRAAHSPLDSGSFDEKAWSVIVESAQLARRQGWPEIRTPHLFAAMIGDGSGVVGLALRRERIDPDDMKIIVLDLVHPRPPLPHSEGEINFGRNAYRVVSRAISIAASAGRAKATEEDLAQSFFTDEHAIVNEILRQVGVSFPSRSGQPAAPGRGSILYTLGVDLTEKARLNQLPEIVGRDAEIEAVMHTLLLTENANPLLVGEAGVGKTAIVEGIAQRIARGKCPQKLASMRVIELSAGRLVANTRLRGEFEQRIQMLIQEAVEGVILFIDEIHTIVRAGTAEDSGPDAGNMLKAALARGELRLIGATTHSEYRRTIARDRALSRRFQVQMIGPPSREATISALSARQKSLEEHHGVRITKGAKIAAVDLSGRFILDRHWPAKARDLLEWACIVAATKKGERRGVPSVTADHVAQVVSRQTGVPVERVSTSEMSALATLEDRINRRIVGQPLATRTIVEAIRRGRRGFSSKRRPWGVFLLTGPPGVGKTWMAEVLAEEVYGGSEGLIRFDMGEFTETHSVARLIGAPPGYVGYDQGAPLVERLRKHPYSLLLFDEIEHAHENVLAVLLRLCSEGTLVDSEGNTADARNSIVIMTSNTIGSEAGARRPGFAPGSTPSSDPSQAELRSMVATHLPVNLIDRLDAIIRFNTLRIEDLEAIAAEKLKEVSSRVAALYQVAVDMSADVAGWLAKKSASESSSARAILRAVEEQVAAPLAAALAGAQASRAAVVLVSISGDALTIEIDGRAASIDA